MDSVTGIMPEELLYRDARKRAIAWIMQQPWTAGIKREALFAWARTVAVRVKESEVQQVINSSADTLRRK